MAGPARVPGSRGNLAATGRSGVTPTNEQNSRGSARAAGGH